MIINEESFLVGFSFAAMIGGLILWKSYLDHDPVTALPVEYVDLNHHYTEANFAHVPPLVDVNIVENLLEDGRSRSINSDPKRRHSDPT